VEEGPVQRIFDAPEHPYTRALLAAVPVLGSLAGQSLPMAFREPDRPAPVPQDTVTGETVLEVRDLVTRFAVRRGLFGRLAGRIHAVEGVSFALRGGETLAVVGESGCGKSTTGRSIIRLEQPDSGTIWLAGRDVTRLDGASERLLRRAVQYVFQDPFASLDPRLTIGFSIAEPIHTHRLLAGPAIEARVRELLRQVGLPAEFLARYPHELSGGQRQRVCIARALASEPQVIIADEAVAALDVSIRAQVVNLLMDLQARLGIACLFISRPRPRLYAPAARRRADPGPAPARAYEGDRRQRGAEPAAPAGRSAHHRTAGAGGPRPFRRPPSRGRPVLRRHPR
jgi:glutathione transport system ATP-binding protein